MSARATANYCPYCGESDIRPAEVKDEDGSITSPHGTWECRGCLRMFRLSMLGMVRPYQEREENQ